MIQFDSNEEMYMHWWLSDLKDKGYIDEIIHQPDPFILSEQYNVDYFVPYKNKDGGKFVSEEIIPPHIYTSDILVKWNDKAINVFTVPINSDLRKKKGRSFQYIICQGFSGSYYSYIEVKPSFDQNNMTRLAKINIKWVFEKHGEFVNIIIPEKHFEKTFTPTAFLTTNKTSKARKIKYSSVLTLDDYLKK
jgi:hypothetical protein